MLIGRVIGTVWATRKEERLEGLKLLVVRELDLDLKPKNNFVVAADVVQAGVGEVVLVSTGSAARQAPQVEKRPIDALVMAVIDNLNVQDAGALEKDYNRRLGAVTAALDGQAEI